MTNEEVLDLFFTRAYENTLNNNILSDVDYVIPIDGILNYVCEVISVPFSEYLDYISTHPDITPIETHNITQSSSFSACEKEMIEVFLEEDNRGLVFDEIGSHFTKYVRANNIVAYRKYGENQVKTCSQLGLAFEYYKHWYLNCTGYIYNELPEDDRLSLLARNILRDPLYRKIMCALRYSDVDILPYMSCLNSSETKYRRYDSVKALIGICIREAYKEKIILHKLIDTKDNILTSKNITKTKRQYPVEEEESTLSVAEEGSHGLPYYINKFKKLRCYSPQRKPAPHKAIMLISVINLIQRGVIKDNRVRPDKALKDEFKAVSASVEFDRSLFTPSFNNPFSHLTGDGFWHLTGKDGSRIVDATNVKGIEYATIDAELLEYMQDEQKSSLLRKALITKYLSPEND